MGIQIIAMWTYLRTRFVDQSVCVDEGSVVEKVILTAIFAALAIAVGAIIVTKVTNKVNSIHLN